MLNSHTHCQVAPADPKARTWQRVCLFQRANDRKSRRKKNTERTTTCIKHLADIALSCVTTRINSSCNLIENRFEMPNVSYTQPLATSVKKSYSSIDTCKIDRFTNNYKRNLAL
jgi:hypothetical protein